MRGYHSSPRLAVLSWRQCVPSQISGIVSTVMCSSVPATVSTSPSGSVVLVGYHRPWAMGGATCHVWEPGARIQNSYSGLGQPDATAVKVTVVPDEDLVAGAAVSVTDPHGEIRV